MANDLWFHISTQPSGPSIITHCSTIVKAIMPNFKLKNIVVQSSIFYTQLMFYSAEGESLNPVTFLKIYRFKSKRKKKDLQATK